MIRVTPHPNPVSALVAMAALASVGVSLITDTGLGLGFILFLALVAAGATITNRVRAPLRDVAIGSTILAFGLLPVSVDNDGLAVLIALASLTAYVVALTNYGSDGRGSGIDVLIHCLFGGCGMPRAVAPVVETIRIPAHAVRAGMGWIIPGVLTLGFLALFAIANPMLEVGFDHIVWPTVRLTTDPTTILIWMAIAFAVWPAVFFQPRKTAAAIAVDHDGLVQTLAPLSPARYLDPRTILRCLVLFNLVFALQTASDIAFLWAGASLPTGVTAASYAHRGAYPLVLTALLAAVFVLIALRERDHTPEGTTIRRLVYLWIGQNILLVISSMLRLDIYVGHYALTTLRAAAFIWMALVAVGLALILVRIACGFSGRWLVQANAVTLALTLYGCTFVSFDAIIAEANVDHALTGSAYKPLDIPYLMRLGPQAAPALDRYAAALKPMPWDFPSWRKQAVKDTANSLRDWRGWTFRQAQLSEYFTNDPYPPRSVSDKPIPCGGADCGVVR